MIPQNPEIERAPGFIDHVPSARELAAGPEAVPTRAETLGLSDGQFLVRRSSGQIETGWSVDHIQADPEGVKYVTIGKLDEEDPDLYLTKVVKADKLLGWQDASEEPIPEKDNPLKEREAKLTAELDSIKARFKEEEVHNLWSYAAGIMNKAVAQNKGDGQGSMLEGQRAGQAYRSLSPEARQAAPEYLRLMQELERVRSKF